MPFDRRGVDKAAQGNSDLRMVLDRIIKWQGKMEQAIGVTPDLTGTAEPEVFAAPPLASMTVKGQSGSFQISITNPDDVKVPLLLHQIQSSQTLPFEASQTIIDYGETSQGLVTIVDPNKTYYWRFRSRFPMGDWNGWQIYQGSSGQGAGSSSAAPPSGGSGTPGQDSIPILLKNKVYQGRVAATAAPTSATPSSTNTGTGTLTFAAPHGWVTGTRCTVSASGGGLSLGTTYYLGIPSTTTCKFYTNVVDAQAGTNAVTLTATISATIIPDAIVIATIPSTAFGAAQVTVRNEGTAANWLLSTKSQVPTTSNYGVTLQPGDPTLGNMGDAYTETEPPTGDICVVNDNPGTGGFLAWYVGWNDGTSPLAGPTGLQGIQGLPGAYGGPVTIDYLFSTSTTNADPTAAFFRLNNATQNAATALYISTTSFDGLALAGLLDSLIIGAQSCQLRIVKKTDVTKFLVFTLGTEITHTNYREFVLSAAASSGSTPFAANSECLLQFGASVSTGLGGSPATNGFRLTLVSGVPIYDPQEMNAVPSATDTTNMFVTFASDPGFYDGTLCTPEATGGGLTATTTYYLHRISATTYSFHTSLANALAGTPKVTLSANITVPIVCSGVTNTTLYYTPYKGNMIGLYNGSSWVLRQSAEVSLALGTLTANTNYDVWARDVAGVLTLDLTAWTSDTVRATALAKQDGVDVKNGDNTRRYIGTIRTDTTTTTINDAGMLSNQIGGKRYVWNNDNRVNCLMAVCDISGPNWAYNTNVWRKSNNAAAGKNQVDFVVGQTTEMVSAIFKQHMDTTAAGTYHILGIGVDGLAGQYTGGNASWFGASNGMTLYGGVGSFTPIENSCDYRTKLKPGYHNLQACEHGGSGTGGFTFYCGLQNFIFQAEVWC